MKTALMLTLVLAGCGSAAGPGYAPPVLTINGTVSAESMALPDKLHVSLVWVKSLSSTTTGGRLGYVADDVILAGQPLAPFQLILDAVPTASDEIVPGASFALATVIAWQDVNANGKLDPIPAGATRSPDDILGESATEVFYIGDDTSIPVVATPSSFSLDPGFNLVDSSSEQVVSAGCDSYDACFKGPQPPQPETKLAPSATITINLTGPNDRTNQLLCQPAVTVPVTDPSDPGLPVGSKSDCSLPVAPSGGSTHVSCYAGSNRIFMGYLCNPGQQLCWSECTSAFFSCPATMQLPADWPCP